MTSDDEINALCERLDRGGLAVQMPDHERLREWLQLACSLLKDDEPAAALRLIEQIIETSKERHDPQAVAGRLDRADPAAGFGAQLERTKRRKQRQHQRR